MHRIVKRPCAIELRMTHRDDRVVLATEISAVRPGAPKRFNRMTDLALAVGFAALAGDAAKGVTYAAASRKRGNVRPLKSDNAPMRISSRRLTPSQTRVQLPRIRSMIGRDHTSAV